jgi:hypothetical protein
MRISTGKTLSQVHFGFPSAAQLSRSALIGRGIAIMLTDEPPPVIRPASE